MPLAVDVERVTLTGYFELAGVLVVVLTPMLVLVSLAADRARRVFRSERALKRINQGTATVMAGVAVAIAVR
jgi:threonine/homoserine/homoserine lactone efflux protein